MESTMTGVESNEEQSQGSSLNASSQDKSEKDVLHPFTCSLCAKTYAHRESLVRHFQRAHRNKRYSCQKCDKSYSTNYYLRLHLEKEHGVEFARTKETYWERTKAETPKKEADATASEESWDTFDDQSEDYLVDQETEKDQRRRC